MDYGLAQDIGHDATSTLAAYLHLEELLIPGMLRTGQIGLIVKSLKEY